MKTTNLNNGIEVKNTVKTVNVSFEFNKAAKIEQMSLNQALKSVLNCFDSEAGKNWAKKYNIKKSDLTIKNIIDNWHLEKIDSKLAYNKYLKDTNGEIQKITVLKTKFTTFDIIRSMQKYSDNNKK